MFSLYCSFENNHFEVSKKTIFQIKLNYRITKNQNDFNFFFDGLKYLTSNLKHEMMTILSGFRFLDLFMIGLPQNVQQFFFGLFVQS
jgi:hypothetical protein